MLTALRNEKDMVNLYVNPFWFGVFCTILAEVVAVILLCIRISMKN
jgi:hypothetical protein